MADIIFNLEAKRAARAASPDTPARPESETYFDLANHCRQLALGFRHARHLAATLPVQPPGEFFSGLAASADNMETCAANFDAAGDDALRRENMKAGEKPSGPGAA
jgi:hypothetical protein